MSHAALAGSYLCAPTQMSRSFVSHPIEPTIKAVAYTDATGRWLVGRLGRELTAAKKNQVPGDYLSR